MMDEESLMILLLRERVKLLAYIRAIVRDEHLAEDVYQDVAVLALRKREEIKDQRHFLAWMRITSRHRAFKVVEKRRHQVLLDESLLECLDEQWSERDASSSADLTEALRQCLEHLTPRARNLVRLRYAEGISGERLAAGVDRSLNAVYVSLSRIHRSLGDCIRRRMA